MKKERYVYKEWHDTNKKLTDWGLLMMRLYIGIGVFFGLLISIPLALFLKDVL